MTTGSGDWSDLDRPPLREAALRQALVAGPLWTDLRVVGRTASTNADVAADALAGAREGLVVVAEHQTAGRGRLERTWSSSPRTGLTFSVLLRPRFPRARWGWLPLLAGLAVAMPLRRQGGLDARLKWPNDVLVGERKVAGVLTEVVGDAVVVGIGVNVLAVPDDLPADVATSLAAEGSEFVDRDPVLRGVLRELARSYDGLQEHDGDAGTSGLHRAYREVCATVGREVRIELSGLPPRSGTASDVDAEGRLVVDGLPVSAGDVVHVR